MNKYYYTFGTDPMFPYCGGHVEIHADNWNEAHKKFMDKFPCRTKNILNCAFYYDESEFTKARENGKILHIWLILPRNYYVGRGFKVERHG